MQFGALAGLLLLVSALPADDYSDLFREAASYSQQGKYDDAISKYQAALALRPGAPEALNNLAVMYYEVHRYANAFDTASKIWPAHPELKSAALIAGMSAVQCNHPREAIAPLNRLLTSDPTNRDALLALASAHLALHQFAEAAHVYERETNNSPNDSTAWYGRAICYENLAEQASRTLSHTAGGAPYSKRLLAEYLQNTGDGALAREAFGESNTTPSQTSAQAESQYELARALAQKSRESFERLVQIAPDSWQTAVFLGDVDRQHGDLKSAVTHYQKAAETQPANPAPLLGLGTSYWELGDFDRASSALRETLKLNPNANQAVFELANIAVRRHNDREAIPLLKRFLVEQPDALAAHADLGRAYAHLGEYSKAALELSKAAPSDERGDIHYQLSTALRKLGRTEEAETALKQSNTLRQAQLHKEERLHADK